MSSSVFTLTQRIGGLIRTPAPAPDTVILKETPRSVRWPTTRPLAEDQPTDHFLRSDVFGPSADEALLADVVAALPHPVIALNADGQIAYWSDAATDVFGWSAADVVGRPPIFLPTARFTEHTRQFVQATAGVRVREFVTDRLHRDGRLISVLVSMAVDGGGGVTCVYQPLPTDVPLAEAVDERQAEPAGKLEILGRVAAGVLHDLANLLAVVRGNADLLTECVPVGHPGHAYAGVIRACVQHAAALTTAARSFAQPTEVKPAVLSLSRVVEDLTSLVRAVAGPGIECVIRPGESVPPVLAARGHLEEVIVVLVSTARDAMPAGGVIGLRTSTVVVGPGRPGWPAACPPGRYACLTVADNGTVDREPARVGEVVDRYHGYVEVDREPGGGTVFRVYFPAMPPKLATVVPNIPHAGESVLLVDDDEGVRAVAKVVLESVGYGVLEAASGDEAARLAKAVPSIDLLVTDMVLPGLTGRKLMARLRAVRPDLPVVLVSGYPQPECAPEAGTQFVKKPFLPPDLLAAVRKVTREVARA